MKDETYFFHQTPPDLAKILITLVPFEKDDVVLEPFRGEGAFYNHLPSFVDKKWTEIEEGKDFQDFKEDVDWVITNPPFRINGKNSFFPILQHFAPMVKKGICFLANDYCLCTLTPNRLKMLNELGLYIHTINVCSIKAWRGRYYFISFLKQPSNFFKFIEGNF